MYKLIYLLLLCSVCVNSKFCTEKRRLYSPESYDWDQEYYSNVKESAVKVCCEGYQETALSLYLRIFYEFKDYLECEPLCDPPCKNGHCTAPGQCTCSPGYSKARDSDICSPVCDVACKRGTCVAPDQCSCLSGYELIDGSCSPICSERCLNGVCVSPERCICHYGYSKVERNACEPCEGDNCLSKYAVDEPEVEAIPFDRFFSYNTVNLLLPLCLMVTAMMLLFILLHWTPVKVNVVEKEEKFVNYLQPVAISEVPELPDKKSLII